MNNNFDDKVQCIPQDELLPAPSDEDFDELSSEDQKISDDWWCGHDYCIGCWEVYALANGSYETPNGEFLCLNCI